MARPIEGCPIRLRPSARFVALLAILAAVACRRVATGPNVPMSAAAPAAIQLPARVVMYGDSRPRLFVELLRENPKEPRIEVIRRIAQERPALVVHSGDLVQSGEIEAQWVAFDREMAPIRDAGIPFYPALGNHEYVGDNTRALANFFSRFPALHGHRWYDVRVGPLVILVVDTNHGEMSAAEWREESEWYRAKTQAAEGDPSIRWVFVAGHAPPYTNATAHDPDPTVEATFVTPTLANRKVRLFVSGHVHSYERFAIGGKTFVVSGGGGAPRMEVFPNHPYHDEYEGPAIRPFHYLLATVEANRVVVDVMMLDDTTWTWSRGDGFVVE